MYALLWDFGYAVILSWVAGKAALFALSSFSGFRKSKQSVNELFSAPDILFAGMIVLTVTAQFRSVFLGASGGAYRSLFLVAVQLVLFLLLKRKFRFYRLLPDKGRPLRMALAAIIFIVIVYGTTHGIEHYDTGLYHAQAIQWIARYGVMKGLGNLHTRLAYNSAAFAFSAVFADGASSHAMAGYAALLLAWKCMDIGKGLRKGAAKENDRGTLYLSDVARLLAIYYLFTIYDEMVSPAPDYFVTCAIFFIAIAWLDAAEKDAGGDAYALFCVAAVYALTLKLSAAPLVLLTVYAVSRLRSFRKSVLYFVTGCVVVFPFLLRNYYLSGYLIYPFPAIDLFDVAWKVPKGVAEYDAREIAVYGRGYTDVLQYDAPLGTWFPDWFKTLGMADKLLFPAALLVPFLLVFFFLQLKKEHRRSGRFDFRRYGILFLILVLDVQFMFWFFTAPLLRYGRMIMWLPACLAVCWLLADASGKRVMRTKGEYAFAITAFVLFFGYKSAMLIRDDLPRADVRWLYEQQPYAAFALEPYGRVEMAGVEETLYAPTEGDRVGATLFASPNRERVAGLSSHGSQSADVLGVPADGFRAVLE